MFLFGGWDEMGRNGEKTERNWEKMGQNWEKTGRNREKVGRNGTYDTYSECVMPVTQRNVNLRFLRGFLVILSTKHYALPHG